MDGQRGVNDIAKTLQQAEEDEEQVAQIVKRNFAVVDKLIFTWTPKGILSVMKRVPDNMFMLPFDLKTPVPSPTIISKLVSHCMPVCMLNSDDALQNPGAFGPLCVTIGSAAVPLPFRDIGPSIEMMTAAVLHYNCKVRTRRCLALTLYDTNCPLVELIRNLEARLFQMWDDAASQHSNESLRDTSKQRSILREDNDRLVVSVNIDIPPFVRFLPDDAMEFARKNRCLGIHPFFARRVGLSSFFARGTAFRMCTGIQNGKADTDMLFDVRKYMASDKSPDAAFHAYGVFAINGLLCEKDIIALDMTAVQLTIVPRHLLPSSTR